MTPYYSLGVSKRANPTRFGAARLWPAKKGSGRIGPPCQNGPKTVTRPVFGRAGGLAHLFFFYFFNFLKLFKTFY